MSNPSGGSRKSPTSMDTGSASQSPRNSGVDSSAAGAESRSKSTPKMALQISSDEINVLIYRYLQESGFVHSAFTFAYESLVGGTESSKANVPPGALISFLQKGLQYIAIEETLRQDGTDRENASSSANADPSNIDFSILSPYSVKALTRKNPPIKLNVPPASAAAAIKARFDIEAKRAADIRATSLLTEKASSSNGKSNKSSNRRSSSNSNGAALEAAKKVAEPTPPQTQIVSNGHGNASVAALASLSEAKKESDSAPMEVDTQSAVETTGLPQDRDIIEKEDKITHSRPDEVLELNKHTSEVFMCAWNPIYPELLATGSGDASARIWTMGGRDAKAGSTACRLLQHGTNSSDKKNKDVTTLEWSSNGELLATGSYDGVARVWNRSGAIMFTLRGHIGPIFSLKWNKSGNFLLSGSYDKTTIVWDVSGERGEIKQQFQHHTAPALDVDWKDDTTFASCSTDKTVLICKVGSNFPLQKFSGHKDEVNAVKWDPSGTLLASCSDDSTAKVWDVSSGKSDPLYDLASHKQEIYTVKWSPTGPGSKNPEKPRMLATASFDSTVRLWNIQDGSCLAVLSRHRESVYSVAFSPSGDYLASGSLAGQLYVWRVKDGKHIKNFKGQGDIFEVAWNKEETRIAACFSSNVVNVIDFKP